MIEDRLKILRELGFKPFHRGIYENTIIEFVGFPFIEDNLIKIPIRLELNNPLSLDYIDVSRIETPLTVLNILESTVDKNRMEFKTLKIILKNCKLTNGEPNG